MMLLRFHFDRKQIPTYRKLSSALGVSATTAGTGDAGVGLEEVTKHFRREGIRYRGSRSKTPSNWLLLKRRLSSAPLMVAMGNSVHRWGSSGHWIVVVDIGSDVVTFLDPYCLPNDRQPLRMRLATFRRQWDGSSIQVIGFK
jgi:hypothetical protein